MAATKKAHKKKIQTTFAVKSVTNFIPLCVQIEHSGASKKPLKLSKSGNRCPYQVYWMLQTNTASASHIEVPLGYFTNDPLGVAKRVLALDQNGMTEVITVSPNAPLAPDPGILWSYVLGRAVYSGGIIIDG